MKNFIIGKDCIGVGVGACIFNEDGQILLALRGKKAKNEVGKWEIPGGAVEFGETIEQALKREIKEELGVEIELIELLQLCDHIIPDDAQHWVSPTYICKIIDGDPRNLEPGKCDRLGWFSLDEALELPLSIVTQHDLRALKAKDQAVDISEKFGCGVLVMNNKRQVLLGKRKNAYKAGWYGFPGGRSNGKETLLAAAKRELLEETGVVATEVEYVGVIKEWQTKNNFIHFMYLCEEWEGKIAVAEPDKCETWDWFELDNLPEKTLPAHREAIELLRKKTVIGDI